MPLSSCSIDLNEVCILFLDDVVGQNHGHITLEGTALWSQALSVQLFSPALCWLWMTCPSPGWLMPCPSSLRPSCKLPRRKGCSSCSHSFPTDGTPGCSLPQPGPEALLSSLLHGGQTNCVWWALYLVSAHKLNTCGSRRCCCWHSSSQVAVAGLQEG